MASVGDTFVTKYELQDNYSPKLKKISGETDKFGKALGQITGGGTGGSLSGLIQGFGTLGGMSSATTIGVTAVASAIAAVATAAIGASVAMAKFGMDAMRAAAPMDTIERTFAGVYGSTKKAADMMAYLQEQAMKSNFAFTDLANAAKLVVMNGLQFSEFSDSMQAIALRGSGNPAENLQTIASTLTRIKAGDFAQAFENLRSFGIGKDTLVALGATFDKSGRFSGNIADALELFKKIGAEGKGVVDAMDGGMEATLSNFDEGFNLLMQNAGKQVFANFKPMLDGIINTITTVLDSGVIKDTVNAISEMFSIDSSENGMLKIAAGVLTTIEMGAYIVRGVLEGIKNVLNFINDLLKFIPGFTPLGMLKDGLGMAGGNDIAAMGKTIYDRNYSTLVAAQGKKKTTAEPTVVKSTAQEASKEVADAIQKPSSPIAQIAKNTKETAQNTKANADMSRHILGGGDMGRLGLSTYELGHLNGRVRHGKNSAVKVKIEGNSSFEQIVQDIINSALPQLKRQGVI